MIYTKSKLFYFLTIIYYILQYTGKNFYCYIIIQKFESSLIFFREMLIKNVH